MTTNKPLVSRQDIEAIHQGNQLNRQTLQAGLIDLVKDVHKGNTQTGQLIKGVITKWKN